MTRSSSLKKENEDALRRWKDCPCSLIGRINIVKMAIFPKEIFRFNAISLENANQLTLISLYKAQVQVDQGPPLKKTRYTEAYRGESGEEP